MANNSGVTIDGNIGGADYVEIRNVSGADVALDDYALVDSSLDASKRFVFPPGTLLQASATLLVFCDGRPDRGPSTRTLKSIPTGTVSICNKRRCPASF